MSSEQNSSQRSPFERPKVSKGYPLDREERADLDGVLMRIAVDQFDGDGIIDVTTESVPAARQRPGTGTEEVTSMQEKRTASVEPMRSHGPGWALDLSERDECGETVVSDECYWLWAPQVEKRRSPKFPGKWSPDGGVCWYDDARCPREYWAACWQSGDGEDGNFVKGTSADEVLHIFPDAIAEQFRAALGGGSQ